MNQNKHIALKIEAELHEKLKRLAEYDDRTITNEIIYLIRQEILKHEKNGSLKG